MKRDVLHSPRLSELKKKRRQKVVWKIVFFFFSVALITTTSAYLARLPNLNITEIQVLGNKVVETEAVKQIAQAQITGKYVWLFPKTNILFYPKNKITTALRNNFTRLQDINLSIKENKILEITVTERAGTYIWCGATPLEVSADQKCYFLSEDGYIFDEAPFFSGDVYFKFYGSTDSSTDSPLGSYFAKENFKALTAFKDVLTSIKLKPVAINITSDKDLQIILAKIPTSLTEPKILLKPNADFQNLAENLQAALNTEPLQTKFKTKYSTLEYIDLRFGNKVYYKFQ